MSLNIRPILSALLRNRTGAVLVALQIAIALAVLVNALYIVVQRIEKMRQPTGIDVDNILVISSAGFTERYQPASSMQEDLSYLRAPARVLVATRDATRSPLRRRQRGNDRHPPRSDAVPTPSITSRSDEQGLAALGVNLIAGPQLPP